jgi:tetratricopeptide (TPR) repeat protein
MANAIQAKPIFSTLQAKGLMRAGKDEEAIAGLQLHLRANVSDHAAWHQLALAQTQQRNFFAAIKAIKKALELAPDVVVYQRFKGIALANMGDCGAAIEFLLPFIQKHPDDYLALHALQIAYCKSGKDIHAIALGRKILKMEDQGALARPLPPANTQAGVALRGSRRIIAYSLWGASPVYNYGAVINARLAPFIYPGWKCRFYLGEGVPATTRVLLKQAGAEIIEAAEKHAGVAPALWRFLVADDPGVAIFICRDCDSRISPKEAAAVDVWLRGGKRAHVMRDHILHRNLMLAGLWGARTERPLFTLQRIQRFSAGNADARYGSDQRFLAREIWPEIRADCLIHDSHYDLFNAQPFPVMGKGGDRFHVGMGITSEEGLRREAQLLGLPWPLTPPAVH